MTEAKRKRLEAAGWKVGTVQEFLDLSDEDMAVIELRLALAEAFRTARAQRKLSQTAVAKLLGSSQSRVAKMEAGDRSVSVDLLVRGLFALGATRRVLGQVITARTAREVRRLRLTPRAGEGHRAAG